MRSDNSGRGFVSAGLRVLGSELRAVFGRRGFDRLPEPVSTSETRSLACKSAFYEEDQISRVIACGFKSTLARELEKLDARSFVEDARMQYAVRDAVIAGGRVYLPGACHSFSNLSPFKGMRGGIRSYDQATLVNSQQGLRYFGHWLRDDCAVYEDLRETPNLLSMQRPTWADSAAYEQVFEQTWNEVTFAHVAELTFFRELGFNMDKARRLCLLRRKLRAAIPVRNQGRIVYISRGKFGVDRNMSNGDEVERAFSSAGIHIVEPGLDGYALMRELLDAEMIITIEGSQASHGVYTLADKGSLLILQPPERFYNPHHEWTRLLGMTYGITIGEKDGDRFRINPDEVFRMMDRLLAAGTCAES